MSTRLLPDFTQFNLPDDSDLFTSNDVEGLIAERLPTPTPLGHDLAFSFAALDFKISVNGSPMLAGEHQALAQWVVVALITPRGNSILYPENFGSELANIIHSQFDLHTIAAEIPSIIEEALLFHDRIESVENITISQVNETLYLEFDIVLDDDARLQFAGNLPIGG